MKITLDQDTLATAVIAYLKSVGVQSDILGVDFRYTRVPYTVFAEVELVEPKVPNPAKAVKVEEPIPTGSVSANFEPLVDPSTLPPETPDEPDEPRPEIPAAPLFGGGN